MTEPLTLVDRLNDPATRRFWLLCEALRCMPLDRAIELARDAEAFIMGSTPREAGEISAKLETEVWPNSTTPEVADETIPKQSAGPKRLAISAHDREQLLDRLAQGATNDELAKAFGLTSRQVQGVRIGAAREIAHRRNRPPEQQQAEENPEPDYAPLPASPEDVVRYLRQQSDVVVQQDDADFLVNGRFRLSLAELVSRANRMRHRQSKPEFVLVNGNSSRSAPSQPASRHPIFWEEPRPATSNS